MTQQRGLLAFAVAGLAVATTLDAQAQVFGEGPRPDQKIQEWLQLEDPFTRPRNTWEFSGQLAYLAGKNNNIFRLQSEVEYGITDQWQVGGVFPLVHNDPKGQGGSEFGIGDIAFNGMWNFFIHQMFTLSAKAELGLPTGSDKKGLGLGSVSFKPTVVGAVDVGPVQINGEIGFFVADSIFDFVFGVAAVYPVEVAAGHWLYPALEFYGQAGDTDLFLISPSVYYDVMKNLQLGLGIPIGLGKKSPDVGVVFNATYFYP